MDHGCAPVQFSCCKYSNITVEATRTTDMHNISSNADNYHQRCHISLRMLLFPALSPTDDIKDAQIYPAVRELTVCQASLQDDCRRSDTPSMSSCYWYSQNQRMVQTVHISVSSNYVTQISRIMI